MINLIKFLSCNGIDLITLLLKYAYRLLDHSFKVGGKCLIRPKKLNGLRGIILALSLIIFFKLFKASLNDYSSKAIDLYPNSFEKGWTISSPLKESSV